MQKILYFKLFIFSIVGALLLSLVSLYCLVRISDVVVEDYRYGYLLSIARSIEKTSSYRPVSEVNVSKVPTPALPKKEDISLLEISEMGASVTPHSTPKKNHLGPALWLVSKDGQILSSNRQNKLPVKWTHLPRPKKIHGVGSNENFLFTPRTFVMKLDTIPQTFLVSHNEHSLFQGPFLKIQGIHTFATVALAVFVALSISFYYLRRKSKEAHVVLSKLERGDLKARFEIKRFDQFGNLILDFNRMADKIEKLVERLSHTEASRSNLLQELGHDLRTPLTSLNTAFETLREHDEVLSKDDRHELYGMIGADIHYFKDLLEKLTVIATIEGVSYKSNSEAIDLNELLSLEVKNRQNGNSNHLEWKFECEEKTRSIMLGDQHLMTRLFKNALDNASHYAKKEISIKLQSFRDRIDIVIKDDGPGLTDQTIKTFGSRRERRHVKERDAHDFSLGLGSVIMKTIAEAHNGKLQISNLSGNHSGAQLQFSFKRS